MKAKKGADFTNSMPDEGEHDARCIWIIQLGKQLKTYKGVEKEVDQIQFTFELPNSLDEFTPGKGLEPHVVSSERFTDSLGERANMRKFIEEWRGEKFTNGNEDNYDVDTLAGMPCGLEIEHNISQKNGKTYANIKRIICPKEKKNKEGKVTRKKREVPKLINPTLVFEFGVSKKEVFDRIPAWIQKIIRGAVNYGEVAHIYGYEKAEASNDTTKKPQVDNELVSSQSDTDDEF